MEAIGQRFDAQPEDARNFVEMQSEEIFDLGAGDQDRNAVGESDDDRARDKFHRRAQPGNAHDHKQNAGHHGAHEQSVDAMNGNDACDHDDKCARRSADLRL